MEQVNLLSAKCNFQILINIEKFRIILDTKKGNTEKVDTHKRHLNFLLEIYEVFEYMDKSNQIFSSRNMELSYANDKLRFENDLLTKKNKLLMQGL